MDRNHRHLVPHLDVTPTPCRVSARRLMAAVRHCLHNIRTRHLLAQFSERELADAGIDRCQRERELSKPFWR